MIVLFPGLVSAQQIIKQFENAAGTKGAGYNLPADAASGPVVLVGRLINYALVLVGVIFLVMAIYGGFLYMTAGGNEEQVKKGKRLITNTFIGLVIVLAAYAISSFVVGQVIDATTGGETAETTQNQDSSTSASSPVAPEQTSFWQKVSDGFETFRKDLGDGMNNIGETFWGSGPSSLEPTPVEVIDPNLPPLPPEPNIPSDSGSVR